MAESTQVVVNTPEHEYLNETPEKPAIITTKVPKETSTKTARVGSLLGLLFFLLASIIPILEIFISRRYADKCPGNWHIPHYLLVAGTVGLVVIILGVVKSALTFKLCADTSEDTPKTSLLGALFCVTPILVTLLLFLFIWFILGCYWVFHSRKTIQHTDPNQDNYCHPVLYKFAFWLLIISIFFKLLSCFQSCWKTPHNIKQYRSIKKSPDSSGP